MLHVIILTTGLESGAKLFTKCFLSKPPVESRGFAPGSNNICLIICTDSSNFEVLEKQIKSDDTTLCPARWGQLPSCLPLPTPMRIYPGIARVLENPVRPLVIIISTIYTLGYLGRRPHVRPPPSPTPLMTFSKTEKQSLP